MQQLANNIDAVGSYLWLIRFDQVTYRMFDISKSVGHVGLFTSQKVFVCIMRLANNIDAVASYLWLIRFDEVTYRVFDMLKSVVASYLWPIRFDQATYMVFDMSKSVGVPILGDWNGAGAHTNYSTKSMREDGGYKVILKAIKKLSYKHKEHIAAYGEGNERRFTGRHETADINTFKLGVANRGASIRVGRDTEKDEKGYFKDKRPASNMDTYVITSIPPLLPDQIFKLKQLTMLTLAETNMVKGIEGIEAYEETRERRSDFEISEDERRHSKIGALRKKAINASNKFTHSLKKRGKRKIDYRVPSVLIKHRMFSALLARCLVSQKACKMSGLSARKHICRTLQEKEVDINKKTENQAKMTKLSMEWKRLCKIKAKETTDNIVQVKERLKAARDRQKSYADNQQKPLEFSVSDKVLLKVSPWKGIICFGKRSKLSSRYVGPFDIVERVGLVAYQLRLRQELVCIHNTFHVSNLKKCLANVNLHVPLEEIKIDKGLCFVEEPIEGLDREIKKLKQSKILIVRIRWNSRRGPEYCWEREDEMKHKYP
ncbi:putative reverse transcriptase domain-containing protein [Tanacetum coccineum]|uniref:glutamine synthetase n=1 Tax=Tanacetum coccineum TaxID=301880 RepID=A0ABQ5A5Y9_9ASTR